MSLIVVLFTSIGRAEERGVDSPTQARRSRLGGLLVERVRGFARLPLMTAGGDACEDLVHTRRLADMA